MLIKPGIREIAETLVFKLFRYLYSIRHIPNYYWPTEYLQRLANRNANVYHQHAYPLRYTPGVFLSFS